MRSGRDSLRSLEVLRSPELGWRLHVGPEPSLPASPPPSRGSETRNLFPTSRLVELTPGDGRGIDAKSPARGHPNGHVK
jgi:hypothetical protein